MKDTDINFGYIRGIELENIRGFRKLSIDLESKISQRMLSVIIGRNGTCKTTLLRCIALGLCHVADVSALLATPGGQMVSENAKEGSIILTMATTSGRLMGDIILRIKNENGRDVFINRSSGIEKPEFFVCGYGSGRGIIGTSEFRKYRGMDSVATLFDYTRRLVNIELMLRRLKDYMGSPILNRALKGIKRVLGFSHKHHIYWPKGGGVKVSGPCIGEDIPVEGWADGYRMTFNWLIDIYGWAILANAVTESGGVRGILLIDEIDQNLHPKMQRMLLNELRNALPEMQVFATTHSPITALGTESENIIALHRKENQVEVAAVPSLVGYSADDILVEEALFGIDPYPQYTREKLDRHLELASIPADKRTKKQSDELRKLVLELEPEKLPFLRDDPIVKKLDKIEEMLKGEQK